VEENPVILLEEQHLAPLLGDVRDLTVADLGCGTGRHANRLAAAGARVTALDFMDSCLSRSSIRRSRCTAFTHASSIPLLGSRFVLRALGAARSGLTLEHMSEHVVDDDLAARAPRAAKYRGWPLLLLMKLRP
jgi:SAM-dependent methyltransferase